MINRKPGFTYFYSEVLQQEIAISNKTGKVFCSDGVQYTPEEIVQLQKTYGDFSPQVHKIKQIFGGTIINVENKK